MWAALRGVIGYCLAALFMIIESWINARTENRARGRVVGLYQALIFVAVALAQLLVGFGDVTGFVLFSVVAMFYALSLVPIALTRAEPPTLAAPSRAGSRTTSSVAPATTAVFHLRTSAFAAALSLYTIEDTPFATTMSGKVVIPGGFHSIRTVTGSS